MLLGIDVGSTTVKVCVTDGNEIFYKSYVRHYSKVKEILELLKFDINDKRIVKHFSLGMKQKLGLGVSLLKDSDVLILDEPGASLDIVCKQDIMNYLSAYTGSGGTVIITSHEEGELKMADRMYLLKDGVLTQMPKPVIGNELLEVINR